MKFIPVALQKLNSMLNPERGNASIVHIDGDGAVVKTFTPSRDFVNDGITSISYQHIDAWGRVFNGSSLDNVLKERKLFFDAIQVIQTPVSVYN